MKKAFSLYEPAARQGNHYAEANLGSCYAYGLGVKQNYKKAFYWLDRAARADDDNAQYELGLLYLQGHGVPQDRDVALLLFQRAAAVGNAEAKDVIDREYPGLLQNGHKSDTATIQNKK